MASRKICSSGMPQTTCRAAAYRGGQRDALAGASGVALAVAEGVHGLDGFRLPVGDGVGGVLFQSEVAADVDVEVVLVALVAEEGVALGEDVEVDEVAEARQLAFLGGEAPGVEVEVELVVVHDELLEAQDAAVGAELLHLGEPGVVAPFPDPGGHDVGEDETVEQVGEDEDLHVGEAGGGRIEFELVAGRGRVVLHPGIVMRIGRESNSERAGGARKDASPARICIVLPYRYGKRPLHSPQAGPCQKTIRIPCPPKPSPINRSSSNPPRLPWRSRPRPRPTPVPRTRPTTRWAAAWTI